MRFTASQIDLEKAEKLVNQGETVIIFSPDLPSDVDAIRYRRHEGNLQAHLDPPPDHQWWDSIHDKISDTNLEISSMWKMD